MHNENRLLHLSDAPWAQIEAVAAGFYASPNGRKYARLQLLTIEGLLDRTQRAEHPDYEPDTGFKKAKAEHSGEQTTLL